MRKILKSEKVKHNNGVNVKTRILVVCLIVSLLEFCLLQTNVSSAVSPVYNINTELYYDTIQSAIDAPETFDGHTILVAKGVYNENIVLNKTVTLIGEDSSATIIDANGKTYGFQITACGATVNNFTVTNAYRGFEIQSAKNTISKNQILKCTYGIWIFAGESKVTSNNIYDCSYGIDIAWGNASEICFNHVKNVAYGIPVYGSNNIIRGNVIEEAHARGEALTIFGEGNVVFENTLSNSDIGVYVCGNATFYRNNFIANMRHVLVEYETFDIKWDNGVEGNYWDNHTGEDTNLDGILESAYVIKNPAYTDNHPLKRVWSMTNTFNVNGYLVSTYSNSTVGNVSYDRETLSIVVTGPRNTTGFINVTAPQEIFPTITGTLTIRINSQPLKATVSYNTTHMFCYLTYNHSTNFITISPYECCEFLKKVTEFRNGLTLEISYVIISVYYGKKIHSKLVRMVEILD